MSYSKINTYKGCNFAYFLHYGLGVVVPDNPALALGGATHTFTKMFWDVNYKLEDKFVNAFEGMWLQRAQGNLEGYKPIAFRYKDEMWVKLNQGKKMLRLFYKQNIEDKKAGKRPVLSERKLDAPFRGFEITGKLDRVDKTKGKKRRIFDYKSDRIVPDDKLEANFVYSSQFVIYRIIHKYNFNRDAFVWVWYLREGRKFPIRFLRGYEDRLENLLIEVTEGIKENIFPMFVGFYCKSACEYFKPVCKYIQDRDNCISEVEDMVRKGFVKVSKKKWEKWIESKKKTLFSV